MMTDNISHLLQNAILSEQANPVQDVATATQSSTPFAGFVSSMVQETSSLEKKAQDAVMGVMQGTGVDLHDAMIATQKADMSFELALQVRNKAVSAYQTMMGMQF